MNAEPMDRVRWVDRPPTDREEHGEAWRVEQEGHRRRIYDVCAGTTSEHRIVDQTQEDQVVTGAAEYREAVVEIVLHESLTAGDREDVVTVITHH
jgi:hypothetical protein